jgi:DNA-binding MarR family transcriptional regulator
LRIPAAERDGCRAGRRAAPGADVLIDKYLERQDTRQIEISMRQPGRPTRAVLLRRLDEAQRKLGAQSVLISDLVAARVGINSTDLECLDLLYLAGATTAGALARHTGLTTGATTAVIDRLERSGFVRRRRDAGDRRRVLVEVVPASAARIEPLYRPLAERIAELNGNYGDAQLAVVLDYLARALEAGAEHVVWLQTQPRRARRGVIPRRARHGKTGRPAYQPQAAERG